MLHVSRTPVREAFRILESDELVKIISNRGVQVRLIIEEDIDEVWELRRLVEIYCIRKFIKILDEDDFQKLEDNIQKTEQEINQKDYFSCFRRSVTFHVCLMSYCRTSEFILHF